MKRKTLSYAEVNANMAQHEIRGNLNNFVELAIERFAQRWPGVVSIVGKPRFKNWSLAPDNTRFNDANWHFDLNFEFGSHEPISVTTRIAYLAIFEQKNIDLDEVVYLLQQRFYKD